MGGVSYTYEVETISIRGIPDPFFQLGSGARETTLKINEDTSGPPKLSHSLSHPYLTSPRDTHLVPMTYAPQAAVAPRPRQDNSVGKLRVTIAQVSLCVVLVRVEHS